MNQTAMGVLAVFGALAAVFLVIFGALAAYDAMADEHMMDGMWDMMVDMGDMGDMHAMMGGGGPETTGSASGEGNVRIVDFSFQPSTFTVTPGTLITWTNEDSAPHTATGDGFDTGRLDKGESSEWSFNEPGTYDYICKIHPSMEGQIVVSAGS